MKKLTVVQVCFIALSAVINIIGGNLALVLRLPIYLDSIGTFLASALLGPVGGVLAGVVSGVISAIDCLYLSTLHHDRYLFALFYPGADSDRSGSWNSFSDNVVKKMEYFSWGILCVNCGNNYQCVHHSVCVWRSDIFRFIDSCDTFA